MIRFATAEDVDAILAIYAPYIENTTFTFEYTVPTREEMTQRFLSITEQLPWLVWEENGKVCGYAYGSLPFERKAYSWDCEVSIYLAPEAQGRGIGRKLYAVLEEILFQQGYRVIYSLITSDNRGSLAFHEKLGYRTMATFPDCGIKFERWLGVVWMEKRSKLVDIPMNFPVSWHHIVESDEKLTNLLATLSLS